jgi:hypothetical protein
MSGFTATSRSGQSQLFFSSECACSKRLRNWASLLFSTMAGQGNNAGIATVTTAPKATEVNKTLRSLFFCAAERFNRTIQTCESAICRNEHIKLMRRRMRGSSLPTNICQVTVPFSLQSAQSRWPLAKLNSLLASVLY